MAQSSDRNPDEPPRRRPAQSTPRRPAKDATAKAAATRRTGARAVKGAASAAAPADARATAAGGRQAAQEPPVPPQGYDPLGTDPITPPSRGELLRAAIGVTGELARVGRDTSWRLLTDAFRRARG